MFKKLLGALFSMAFAGVIILVLAIAMGVATIIENDYGTMTVQKIIYKSWWFELLWFIFALSLVANIFKYKLYQKSKIGILVLHLAVVIILLGAAITRYISYEGIMTIREGKSSDFITSESTWIQAKSDNSNDVFEKEVMFGSLGHNGFSQTFYLNDQKYDIHLDKFIPNATETIEKEAGDGEPILYIVYTSPQGRTSSFLKRGESLTLGKERLGFNAENCNINISLDSNRIKLVADKYFTKINMTTGSVDTIPQNTVQEIKALELYNFNGENVVLKEFIPKGKIRYYSKDAKIQSTSINALEMTVSNGTEKKRTTVLGNQGMTDNWQEMNFGGEKLKISYGSKKIKIPFSLKLRDFQLERYPGSMSPSSYASEVTLTDDSNSIKKDYRIYMNHVLDHEGYRFFQSGYDQDEKGTILSVNHDYWGTKITYWGYFLLTLGMILTFITGKSRIRKLNRLSKEFRDKRKTLAVITAVLLSNITALAQAELPDSFNIIPQEQADKFGAIIMQNREGRFEPVSTLSGELIRKITKRQTYLGQDADQIMLGMMTFPEQWQKIPLIRVGNKELQKLVGINGKYGAYVDFFKDNFSRYVLEEVIQKASHKPDKERSRFDREVMKVDERLNIVYMIYSGSLLRIFPNKNEKNHKWYTSLEAKNVDFGDANVLVQSFLNWYVQSLRAGLKSNNWDNTNMAIDGLYKYQQSVSGDVLPSQQKIKAEILYNRFNIFFELIKWYGAIGFILMVLLIIQLFKPKSKLKTPIKILIALVFLGFAVQTFGLGLRWYISGHAPWSNGYESMVYISWAVVLAGIILLRKSEITLAATSMLSAWLLGVAALNWLDPQITNLVPVLKSYWLMIHVSVITASYGFLFLGALLGFINLILMIVNGNKNQNKRIDNTLLELTAVNEMSLTIGLLLLSIGTFLGGVWANESWGRYWGWDAKETWSLVSIMVYTFVLHMRMIKGLKSIYAFNLGSILGVSSILMTFFGVNYYLSGLHSYAQGDPIPIPIWIYIAVFMIAIIGVVAYFKRKEVIRLD